ncbi:MAG: UDP-N-acetylmuramyl-tripeptide synthetase, partial [bacterium]
DHLDFHKNMEEYFLAKRKLCAFLETDKGFAGINVDDPHGRHIAETFKGKKITYGLKNEADITAENILLKYSSMEFGLLYKDENVSITSNLSGKFNVYNVMAAAGAAIALDIPLRVIAKAIEVLDIIPGRFERINAGQKFHVIVDFAHSPDSMEQLLKTLRSMTRGKIILVFGCTGERDHDKRAIMGELACKLADKVIISTDDPHNEDPEKIIAEVEEGMKRAGCRDGEKYIKIADRAAAIENAIRGARDSDTVVLAGRGHEKFQDFAGRKVEIDDREVARKVINSLGR